jgi:DnaK suppressor protein
MPMTSDPFDVLQAERRRAEAQCADCEAELQAAAGRADPDGRDDEHDPDGATAAFEQALAVGLLDQARQDLAEIDLALERLAAGAYGRCMSCDGPIEPDRLVVRPAATRCVRCAGAVGRSGRGPGRLGFRSG